MARPFLNVAMTTDARFQPRLWADRIAILQPADGGRRRRDVQIEPINGITNPGNVSGTHWRSADIPGQADTG